MKNWIAVSLTVLLMTGCTSLQQKETTSTDKLQIVATLFPQYDFARQIAGDQAEVTLLLPPGAESHSYEPTPADLVKINEADLFIYTGEAMEGWVPTILESLEGKPMILDISEGIDVQAGHDPEETHHHNIDPHIFTNPQFALQMAKTLENTLCQLDPEEQASYQSRGEAYRAELADLDRQFKTIAQEGKRNKLIFGGRFAFLYFTEAYSLTYDGVYDSCAAEAEPSAADLIRIMDTIKAENIPVVYYEELSNPKTARLISEETGAKMLLLHSCHNISKEELAAGATYLGLMRQNAEHIKEGLN